MEYKSQHKQDEFIINYFKNKRNGVFLDIGAHDGITLSNTYVLEKEFGWTGICFEPMPFEYKKLNECRDSINYNCALYNTNGTETFTLLDYDGYPDMLSGITKDITIDHMGGILREQKAIGGKIKHIKVQTRILNEILEETGVTKIDFMSIDTEGSELKILKSIAFPLFDIEVISCENNPVDPEIRHFLQSQGYSLQKRLGIDDVFVKN
jgi:FkbM family methyltransferase